MLQRYAPDTNFFLQFKSAQELPWREITEADTVELVVLDEVLRELDSHKSSNNRRRSRRAREAFKTLDPLIDDDESEVVVRNANPRVVWRLAPLLPVNRAKPAELDVDSPDGRIVEQALAVRDVLGGQLALLTHDRLPRRLAKMVGLDRQRLPEGWQLTQEADERDQENARLKAELKTLANQLPRIELMVLDEGKSVERIEGRLLRYAPLSDEFIAQAMSIVERRHPEESTLTPGSVTITRYADVLSYQRKRREWLDDVKDRLERHPSHLTFRHGLRDVELVLRNDGFAPAEGLTVEVLVEGTIRLMNSSKHEQLFSGPFTFGLPSPPKLESSMDLRSRWAGGDRDIINRLHNFDHLMPPAPARDPRKFYWEYDDEGFVSAGVTGSCGDFRHQVHEARLPLKLFAPCDAEGEPEGCLRVRYSAKNLPKPVERVFPIRLQYQWEDSEAAVKQLWFDG
jgi:hypothetical protein